MLLYRFVIDLNVKKHKISWKKMANLLEMDVRSYADIENGKNMCSTLTFILLLSQLRNNGEDLLNDLKGIIDDNYKNNDIKWLLYRPHKTFFERIEKNGSFH